jgi:hypothetical protein
MVKGWSYNRAHQDSSKMEFRCRRNPQELEIRLREEIKRSIERDTR